MDSKLPTHDDDASGFLPQQTLHDATSTLSMTVQDSTTSSIQPSSHTPPASTSTMTGFINGTETESHESPKHSTVHGPISGQLSPSPTVISNSHPSVSSIDAERVERIAMLIRQHKEMHINKSTGVAAIPERSFSSTTSPSCGSTPTAISNAFPLTSPSTGALSQYASPAAISASSLDYPLETSTIDSMMDRDALSTRTPSPEMSLTSDSEYHLYNRSISSLGSKTSSSLSKQFSTSTYRALDNSQKHPSHDVFTSYNGLRAPSPTRSSAKFGSHNAYSTESLSTMLTPSELFKQYKECDPNDVGRMLYEGSLPGCRPNDISLIIGKSDAYHTVVRTSYMECFDFSNIGLDQAFRQLCKKLYLAGETQMVDRILYQFSRRYWDCNPLLQPTFRSDDIVYGILFSLVLLNTDLHIVNVGPNSSKRIARRTFLKNTMELVDTMIENDDKLKEQAVMDIEAARKWKKGLELILRDLYASIFRHRIMQLTAVPIGSSDELAASANPQARECTGHDSSNWSLSSSQSVGSMALHTDTKERGSIYSLGHFRRKHMAPGDRSSIMGFIRAATDISASIGSGMFETATNTSTDRTTPTTTEHSERVVGSPTRCTGVILEGLLIRKHILEMGGTRAKNRRWCKFWCILRSQPDGMIELVMHKLALPNQPEAFEPLELSGNSVVAFDDHFESKSTPTLVSSSTTPTTSPRTLIQSPSGHTSSSFLSPNISNFGFRSSTFQSRKQTPLTECVDEVSSLSSTPPDRRYSAEFPTSTPSEAPVIRLAMREPEVFPLLHACCSILHAAYSIARPHVLALKLANGSEYFFQSPTHETVTEWSHNINYWAARKSKEPMRGSASSMEYGWTWIIWERKVWQTEGPQPPVDEDMMGPLYYFQNLRLRTGSVDTTASAARTSNASMASSEPLKSSSTSVRSVASTMSDGSATTSNFTPSTNGTSVISFGFSGSRTAKHKSKPKPKISEWIPPGGLGHIVSPFSEAVQLESMQRQVNIVKTEILEHLSFKEPMDKHFADSPSTHSKASLNWNRRLRYLEIELQKFTTYVRVLTDGREHKEPTYLTGSVMAAMSKPDEEQLETVSQESDLVLSVNHCNGDDSVADQPIASHGDPVTMQDNAQILPNIDGAGVVTETVELN
ncbi:hypothetical protein BDV3_006704 [Batrachochytrium dendrobatidis]